MMPSSMPMTKPPKLEVRKEARERRTATMP